MRRTRPLRTSLVPLYLTAQAILVGGWWLALWWWPPLRQHFVVGGWPEGTLLAFWLPDLAMLVIGSVTAAIGLRRQRAWADAALWLVAGAVAYATLWCLGANLVTGAGWLSTALMLASSLGTGWAVRAAGNAR